MCQWQSQTAGCRLGSGRGELDKGLEVQRPVRCRTIVTGNIINLKRHAQRIRRKPTVCRMQDEHKLFTTDAIPTKNLCCVWIFLDLGPPKASVAPGHAPINTAAISLPPHKPPASLLARSSVLCRKDRLAISSARYSDTRIHSFNSNKQGLYLCESNILSLLPEALTADVQAVLADETGPMRADAAIEENVVSFQLPSFTQASSSHIRATLSGRRTKIGCPCRMFGDGRTRRFRET